MCKAKDKKLRVCLYSMLSHKTLLLLRHASAYRIQNHKQKKQEKTKQNKRRILLQNTKSEYLPIYGFNFNLMPV